MRRARVQWSAAVEEKAVILRSSVCGVVFTSDTAQRAPLGRRSDAGRNHGEVRRPPREARRRAPKSSGDEADERVDLLRERMEKARQEAGSNKAQAQTPAGKGRSRGRESAGEAFVKSVARSLGSATGRRLGERLLRGVLGSLLK